MEFNPKYDITKLQDSENINEMLSEDESAYIGRRVVEGYDADERSRDKWREKMQDSLELALQVTKQKTYPWAGAANVKFPLLTIASLQFASRAYPALVKAPQVAKMRKTGDDLQGQKAAAADRVSAHMSWQLLEQDEQWEEDQDKAFLALPILGCIFKKSYYDPALAHNCSKTILPQDLAVDYYAKSIEQAERKTHIFDMYDRQIRERELRKMWSEVEYSSEGMSEKTDTDKRQGITPPMDDRGRPRKFLEQHTYIDLDGDGYKEPYVVTVHKQSRRVVRIVHRFRAIVSEQSLEIEDLTKRIQALAEGLQPPEQGRQPSPQEIDALRRVEALIMQIQAQIEKLAAQKPKILRIEPIEYFTKYSFIPSPDGGFYDLGFGALLGPLNDSVNTLVNQLIDSGSLQNNGGGFIGAGVRVKGGRVQFKRNEWKRVDVAGGTLRDNIVPMPINEPSPVLFNLLSLLISYSERVASVNDAMMGENPGQNTPAYNYSAMLEQGLQVFNGIFKRVYRAFRSELRKLYNLNAIYLDANEYFEWMDAPKEIARTDYALDTKNLIPAADPNAFSNKEKMMKAQAVAERAMGIPGYNSVAVEKRVLESLDIPDIDEIFPTTPDGQLVIQPAPNPEFELRRAEEQRKTLDMQADNQRKDAVAESDIMLKQAQAIKALADARATADEADIRQMELIVKELADKRKSLIEVAKIEQQDNARAASGVDG